jgi:hypothetical protein
MERWEYLHYCYPVYVHPLGHFFIDSHKATNRITNTIVVTNCVVVTSH